MRHPPFLHPLLEREVGGEILVYKKNPDKETWIGCQYVPSLLFSPQPNSSQLCSTHSLLSAGFCLLPEKRGALVLLMVKESALIVNRDLSNPGVA